jgi:hypothetical protein
MFPEVKSAPARGRRQDKAASRSAIKTPARKKSRRR